MEKLIKESQYFVTWLLFWICSAIGGLVLGAVGGFVTGAILGAAGVDVNNIKVICGSMGFILGIPLSYILFRLFVGNMIVKKAQKRIKGMMQESQHQALEDNHRIDRAESEA